MSKGVPWDVAHSLEPDRRLAYVIFYGELEGGTWDWSGGSEGRGGWKPQS